MRPTTNLFLIDGVPMLAPKEEPEFSFEDIDAADAGRDETGHMHRNIVLWKVGKWSFEYPVVTNAEYKYIESLFMGKTSFMFTRPNRLNPALTTTTECYRSKYKINWKSAKRGIWVNYSFNIIEM